MDIVAISIPHPFDKECVYEGYTSVNGSKLEQCEMAVKLEDSTS